MFFIPVFLPSAKGSGAGSKTVVQSLICVYMITLAVFFALIKPNLSTQVMDNSNLEALMSVLLHSSYSVIMAITVLMVCYSLFRLDKDNMITKVKLIAWSIACGVSFVCSIILMLFH